MRAILAKLEELRSSLRWGMHAAVLGLIVIGLTGCYTQMASLESERSSTTDQQQDVEQTAEADDRSVTAPRQATASPHQQANQVWDVYEARYDGAITRSEYRRALRDLGFYHYGSPTFYYAYFGDPLFHDPFFRPRASYTRFRSFTVHRSFAFHDPFFHDPFFFGPRYSFSIHFGSTFGHRPFFARSGFGFYRSRAFHGGTFGTFTPVRVVERQPARTVQPRGETIGRSTARGSTGRSLTARDSDAQSRTAIGRMNVQDQRTSADERSSRARSTDARSDVEARADRSTERTTRERTTRERGNAERVRSDRSSDGRSVRTGRAQNRVQNDRDQVRRLLPSVVINNRDVESITRDRLRTPSQDMQRTIRERARERARSNRSNFNVDWNRNRDRSRTETNRTRSRDRSSSTRSRSNARSSDGNSSRTRSSRSSRSSDSSARSSSRSSSDRGSRSSSRSSNDRGSDRDSDR